VPKKQAKSCYQRHRKREYAYSTLYGEWRQAVKSGDSERVRKAAAAHNRSFNLTAREAELDPLQADR
jgi:hypothetical protein